MYTLECGCRAAKARTRAYVPRRQPFDTDRFPKRSHPVFVLGACNRQIDLQTRKDKAFRHPFAANDEQSATSGRKDVTYITASSGNMV